VKGSEPLLGVADVPRTPFVDAGAVEAAGEEEDAGAVAPAVVFGLDECCAPLTPLLVAGEVFEVLLLFVVELLVVELLVVELLVVELFVVELFVTELFVVLLFVTLVVVVTVVVLLDEPH
jgi:hypothetical protein